MHNVDKLNRIILIKAGGTMIALETLSVGYESKRVIKDLNTTIKENKITCIIGPNGCGKSTLLKAMTRVLKPDLGQVVLNGKDIHHIPSKELAKKMAFLPQSHDKVTGLSVYDLVSYGRYPYQKGFGRLTREDYEKIDWALEATGIASYKDMPLDALSGGQKQRAWIAMALVQDTKFILLDEPTTYLDIAHQLDTLELLKKLNKENNRTIVMVLHDINQAAYYADEIIAIKDGVITHQGDPYKVINKKSIETVFNVSVDIMYEPKTQKPVIYNYKNLETENNEKI